MEDNEVVPAEELAELHEMGLGPYTEELIQQNPGGTRNKTNEGQSRPHRQQKEKEFMSQSAPTGFDTPSIPATGPLTAGVESH